MKTNIQKVGASLALIGLMFHMLPVSLVSANTSSEIIFPLKEVSKLECRFEKFHLLGSECRKQMPLIKSSDYERYATLNGGYNRYTRLYTVLHGASYRYGWDVGMGGHHGIDIATAEGTPVYSIADGTVIAAGTALGWGKYVSIEHTIRGQKIVSNYAHLHTLEVNEGDRVRVGVQIGTVGNTGNSTGNHLHFQIDRPHTFHPWHYNSGTCPLSYNNQINTNECLGELHRQTIDPIVFFETHGAVVNTPIQVVPSNPNTQQPAPTQNTQTSSSGVDMSVFNRTVYIGYSLTDTRSVQQIMKDLGYYNEVITSNYEDVVEAVTNYQLDSGVISSRDDEGAGWFGPRTRSQAKVDYDRFLANNSLGVTIQDTPQTSDPVAQNQTPVISRENLMTREEIEAMEIAEFLKNHTLNFNNTFSQLDTGSSRTMQIVFNTERGRGFRGNTPGEIHFEFNSDVIDVFPRSFYNFTDGIRDIRITGKNTGHTTLHVKLGDVILRTFSLSVGQAGVQSGVSGGKIYTQNQVVLGEDNRAIVLLRDEHGNRIVRKEFDGTFHINGGDNIKYCLKRGTLQNIRATFARTCHDEEYTDTLSFSYKDTIGGLLLFDYKILTENKVELRVMANAGNTLTRQSLTVNAPKNLRPSHPYFNEIVQGIKAGELSGFRNGYFLEDESLTQRQANTWIGNIMRERNINTGKLEALRNEPNGVFIPVTRKEFLTLASKYLGGQSVQTSGQRYLDLDANGQTLVASTLGPQYSWRDNFGNNYFQPDATIKRGEAVYLLSELLKTQGRGSVAAR
ncbi:M23 family metallopeptidase [Candidatus Gracilibacteria bacterium]|nr:M23 family metallopeptidase [Candidatus Gracilibacteria bacterium]